MGEKSLPQDGLTLANITVVHTVGARRLVRTGPVLAKLMEATQALHDPTSDDLDFLDPSAIAIELNGLGDVLHCLGEGQEVPLDHALSSLGDQLRRIAHRVGALAPAFGNRAPEWYYVEVTP